MRRLSQEAQPSGEKEGSVPLKSVLPPGLLRSVVTYSLYENKSRLPVVNLLQQSLLPVYQTLEMLYSTYQI